MKSGYLYIISNKVWPNWIKVGVTENLEKRLRQYKTSDPNRQYKIEFYIFHENCYEAEKRIKKMMKMFCKSQKHEWYEIDLSIAISRLEETVLDYEEGLY